MFCTVLTDTFRIFATSKVLMVPGGYFGSCPIALYATFLLEGIHMQDLPSQGLLQQMHARPISGERLEVLGKHASAGFLSGRYKSLTEAVVGAAMQAAPPPQPSPTGRGDDFPRSTTPPRQGQTDSDKPRTRTP